MLMRIKKNEIEYWAFLHLILHLLRIKLFHSVEMVISRKPIKKFNRLMDGLFDELLLAE